jgi:hypothetical protein
MTRWLERIFARPAVFGTIAGVVFLCGSSPSTAARDASREALSDAPAAASAPFLRATAPHRVDVRAQMLRRVMPHADNNPPAQFSSALSIDAFVGKNSPRTGGPRLSSALVARGYDATAPPAS